MTKRFADTLAKQQPNTISQRNVPAFQCSMSLMARVQRCELVAGHKYLQAFCTSHALPYHSFTLVGCCQCYKSLSFLILLEPVNVRASKLLQGSGVWGCLQCTLPSFDWATPEVKGEGSGRLFQVKLVNFRAQCSSSSNSLSLSLALSLTSSNVYVFTIFPF